MLDAGVLPLLLQCLLCTLLLRLYLMHLRLRVSNCGFMCLVYNPCALTVSRVRVYRFVHVCLSHVILLPGFRASVTLHGSRGETPTAER